MNRGEGYPLVRVALAFSLTLGGLVLPWAQEPTPPPLDGTTNGVVQAAPAEAAPTVPETAAVASQPGQVAGLPSALLATVLKRMMAEQSGTFEVVDIRTPGEFADYNVPGSRNVDINDLLSNVAFLEGTAMLVIVDRDGAQALAVAGIVSQKTKRPVAALKGGLKAYWEATELRTAVPEVPPDAAVGKRLSDKKSKPVAPRPAKNRPRAGS